MTTHRTFGRPAGLACTRRALLTRFAGMAGGVGAGILVPSWARAAGSGGAGLFGYTDVRRENSSRFPKWKGALNRTFKERESLARPCRPGHISGCQMHEWQSLLDSLGQTALPAQLDTINREMNRRKYVLDPVNWGVKDYWASPAQFFRKNGDCEDFSIAKYMSLRALGIPAARMRVVVLNDENLRIPHAILAVHDGRDELVLDNQISQVVSHRLIRHYRPIFSINEEGWWLHR
ncbi:MAG: transglutaminase-like cysteine peptidase [Alphaproteobacteria bacterium]